MVADSPLWKSHRAVVHHQVFRRCPPAPTLYGYMLSLAGSLRCPAGYTIMHLPALTPCPPTLTTLESLSQTQWCLIPACLGWTRLRNFLTTTPCSLQTGAISGHGDTFRGMVSLGELAVSNLWFPLHSRLITPAIRPARLALPLPISLTRLPVVAALLSSRLCSSPCTMSFSTYGSSLSLFQLHVLPFCRLFWRLHLHFSRLSATVFCESRFPAFLPLKLLYGRNHMLVPVLHSEPMAVCTVDVPTSCSIYQLAYIVEKACDIPQPCRIAVARQEAHFTLDGASFPPFVSCDFAAVDSAVYAAGPFNTFRLPAARCTQWLPRSLTVACHADLTDEPVGDAVLVHSASSPPVLCFVPHHVGYGRLCTLIRQQLGESAPFFLLPQFCPAGADLPLHLVVSHSPKVVGHGIAILDLRRVCEDGGLDFFLVPLPELVDLQWVRACVKRSGLSCSHISSAYFDDKLLVKPVAPFWQVHVVTCTPGTDPYVCLPCWAPWSSFMHALTFGRRITAPAPHLPLARRGALAFTPLSTMWVLTPLLISIRHLFSIKRVCHSPMRLSSLCSTSLPCGSGSRDLPALMIYGQ